MRRALLERARAEGWTVREVRAGPAALRRAEALLVTNSLMGAVPISALDGRLYQPEPRADALAGDGGRRQGRAPGLKETPRPLKPLSWPEQA